MRPHIWWNDELATVAAALVVAFLLYVVVVLAFRVGKRRTVAELAPFDLAAVIAVGAITGRTATGGNSVTVGLAAIAGLFAGHWLVSRLRRRQLFRKAVDHPTSVLILDGRVDTAELRRVGLARWELDATLRGQGVRSLDEVAVAVFETRNGVSILRHGGEAPLWENLDRRHPGRRPPG